MIEVGRFHRLRAGLPSLWVIGGDFIADLERGDSAFPAGHGDQRAGGKIACGDIRMKMGLSPRKTLCDFNKA